MEASDDNFEILVRFDREIFESTVRETPANAEAVIRVRRGDTFLVGRKDETWGKLTFLVPHFIALLRELSAIEEGKHVEVSYPGTPGYIAFIPRSDETIGVRVDDPKDGFPDDGLPVAKDVVIREIVETGREVLDRIEAIDPNATDVDEVREFQELLEAAEQKYQ